MYFLNKDWKSAWGTSEVLIIEKIEHKIKDWITCWLPRKAYAAIKIKLNSVVDEFRRKKTKIIGNQKRLLELVKNFLDISGIIFFQLINIYIFIISLSWLST